MSVTETEGSPDFGYKSEGKKTIEINFLKNESQTMMTFVSKVHSQSPTILGWYLLPISKIAQANIHDLYPLYIDH